MPKVFKLDSVVYYMVFFVSGVMFGNIFECVKDKSMRYWYVPLTIFIMLNVLLSKLLFDTYPFIYRFILPFTGTWAVMTVAFLMQRSNDNSFLLRFVNYCGRYSLQFYLFTFAYPFIRVVVVKVCHITEPALIIPIVFTLQLIFITIFVEFTRRVKWLKIPCGY